MRLLRAAVPGLAALAVLLRLASYSWLADLTPPTAWIDPQASPWLLAEIGAVVAAGLSLLLGALLLRRAGRSRGVLWGIALGGVVLALTLASLLQP